MKKPIFAAFTCLVILVSACTEKDKTISTDEIKAAATKAEPEIKYGTSVIIDNTDFILYPLNLNVNGGETDSYKSLSSEINFWNIIFYNVNTGKSELLTKDKLIINNFRIGNSNNSVKKSVSLSNNFIYYEITNTDFDGDKKLTTKDANKLFVSNLEGKSFVQISPENYSVNSCKIDDKHNLILMDLVKDANGDKEFNDKDEVEYFWYNLKTGAAATEVFDKAFKDEVKNLAKKVL